MGDNNLFEEEHSIFRQTLQKFCEKELLPHVEEWEENRLVPREIWKKMAENGYLGVWVDEKYGGVNADIRYLIIMWEELSKVCLGFSTDMCIHSDVILPYLNALGTEEQKQEWIPKCLTGDVILAIGMTEPDCGSDLAQMRTKAVLDGDEWVINGSKIFITNGFQCDLIVLAAKTNPDAKHKGISLFLVPYPTKGFVKSKKLKKTGVQAGATAELSFEDVRIPKANLLGELNKGFYHMMMHLVQERLQTAVGAIAIAEQMLNLTISYTKERIVFGKPVCSYQTNAFKIVEMKTEIEMCKNFYYSLARDYLQGKDVTEQVTMAKWYNTELANRVAYNCTQMHGGSGFMSEYAVARCATDVRCMTWVTGTNEIMKEILARNMGLYAR